MKALLPLMLAIAAPVVAQAPMPMPAPGPPCPAAPPFAGFEKPVPVTAAAVGEPIPALAIGRAAAVTLRLAAVPAPARDHPSQLVIYSGSLTLTVARAGTYRIGLDGHVWVDVMRGDTALASTAHGHGPDCGPVRKIVDFALEPGTYTIDLNGSAKPSVTLMVAAAP